MQQRLGHYGMPLGNSLPRMSSQWGKGWWSGHCDAPPLSSLPLSSPLSPPPFFFLWELSVLKTSSLRTIFFWVKGEKCSISSKWKALRPPAPGICPRSFLPLGEVGKGGGEEVSGSRGGESEGKDLCCGPGAVGVWKQAGLFVLERLKA